MELENITKAATLKCFLKTHNSFFYDSFFSYFHEANINRSFLGVTQKYELRVSSSHLFQEITEKPISLTSFFWHALIYVWRLLIYKTVPSLFVQAILAIYSKRCFMFQNICFPYLDQESFISIISTKRP